MEPIKLETSTLDELRSALENVDFEAKKGFIAQMFIYAYGYENVKNLRVEDLRIDDALDTIEKNGIKLQPQVIAMFPSIEHNLKMRKYAANNLILCLAEEISM